MGRLILVILPVLAVVVAVVFGFLLWRLGAVKAAPRRHLDRAQLRSGPAQIEALLACLEAMPAAGGAVLVELWPQIEAALLTSLPDCPPVRKPRFAAALGGLVGNDPAQARQPRGQPAAGDQRYLQAEEPVHQVGLAQEADHGLRPTQCPVGAGRLGAFEQLTGDRHQRPVQPVPTDVATQSAQDGGPAGSPMVAEGLVVAITGHPQAPLVALDAVTGTLRWRATGSQGVDSRGWSSPIIRRHGDRRLVIANTAWHNLRAASSGCRGTIRSRPRLIPR